MSRPKISNPATLIQPMQLIKAASAIAYPDRHRALIVLRSPPDGALGLFAAAHEMAYIGSSHTADRADRITEVLGSEFDMLVHETHEDVDVGLLAALAGTVKAGGVLILGLPFHLDSSAANSGISRFNQRFAKLLADLLPLFPGKIRWLQHSLDSHSHSVGQEADSGRFWLSRDALLGQRYSPLVIPEPHHATASREQQVLLQCARDYLECHERGCITITGRRGRGKSALMGQIASWLKGQGITVAVTAARRPALTSLLRHSSGPCKFVAPADAHRSGCQVLLVEEASSLPLSLLESVMETHQHVVYCSTVEGYENAGRAFELRFRQRLKNRRSHALTLQPTVPWRWAEGDPLELLIDTLLAVDTDEADSTCLPVQKRNPVARQSHLPADVGLPSSGFRIYRLDRTALAFDEPLLKQVYGLLRDTHYQTSATDLSHLLDAPDLQLWALEENGQIKAALMAVLEGNIQPCLHELIVSKQRRLPHQLLPQLLAQSANATQALTAIYTRIIRIAVARPDRRRGLGTELLHAVESASSTPAGQANALGASFASDTVSIAFWKRNGFTRFHTGFKRNPRTGRPAVAVIKSKDSMLEPIVRVAVTVHDDNWRCIDNVAGEPDSQHLDNELLLRFSKGQRSVQDTFAALSRLARQHAIPLQQDPATPRRQYEAILRETVKSVLQ